MTWRRWLSFAAFSLTAPLAARPAAAQLAPTGGHYANQPSDTGFTGGVNSSGGYSTSIPLDLPGARNGLPVPVSIIYGGGGVGAAGLGWDVPLSYIRRDNTIAHRRPKLDSDGSPQARERVSLVLDGRALELVQTGSEWVARRDAPDILVRQQGDGTWVMFDGGGRTYSFTVAAMTGASSMWLLKSISGVGGSKVELDYSITTPAVPGGGGLAIDLTGVSYNPHPTTANCFKNSVALVYDADVAPLSLSVLGDRILVRTHKLMRVNVHSKATCGDAYARLRAYQLAYAQDVDTHQPRLQSVTVTGREGTPEGTSSIPLGFYRYGTASSNGALQYQFAEHIISNLTRPRANLDASPVPSAGVGWLTKSTLLDMSGDGLPDVVFFIAATPALRAYFDWIHSQAAYDFADSVLPNMAIEARTLEQLRYQTPGNVDRLWRQPIDVNGDGRIDIVDAAGEAGHWVVYLNVPRSDDARFTRWEKRSYSIQQLAARLSARGFSVDPNFIPLAQRTTRRQHTVKTCWMWQHGQWRIDPDGFDTGVCEGPEVSDGLETTFTDWEVTDINGDGYPDVIFNSSPVGSATEETPPPTDPPPEDPPVAWVTTNSTTTPALPSSNEIDAVINVLGVHVSVASQPFSPAILLRANDPCGVASWTAIDRSHQKLVCSIIDANGDGIADRVNNQSVYLGTGTMGASGAFTSEPMLALPGPLATQLNDQVAACASPATLDTEFTVSQIAGLRDLTGDGIPDYVTADGTGGGNVQIGTGTGFLAAIPINGMFVALSSQGESCRGNRSETTAGLFDVDGDGKPEVLGSNGNVYKLISGGALGAPEAGRLVTVDNGFGATTKITYRSAKLLASSAATQDLHQVPFPEVVVSSVETLKTQSPDITLLAKTQYAYGGAQLVFDAAHDAFRFPGYRRHVALRIPTEQAEGLATITDAYGPSNTADPYDLAAGKLTADQRYARLLRHGRVSDVTVLAGNFGTDPSALLAVDVTTDARRIANTHYEYDAKLLADASSAPEACNEMVYPYDYKSSKTVSDPDDANATDKIDACRQRGFAFTSSVESFRGEPGAAPRSAATATTRSETRRIDIDDFGRVTRVKQLGDLARDNDDVCIETTYAAPTGEGERVLSAVASQAVTDCGTTIYAKDTWKYDELEIGNVSAGLPTAHIVERRDETGNPLGEIHEFDATFDTAGNPHTMKTSRDDDVSRTATVEYDPFQLVPVLLKTEATGVSTTQIVLTRDPFTLSVLTTTDANSIQHGTTFDGFNRPVMSTVTPSGGTLLVLSVASYGGFSGGDPQGRHITSAVFTDPVPPPDTHNAPGRSVATYFDELGRDRYTEGMLGDDYPGLGFIVTGRKYDSLGRVLFDADPFTSPQNDATVYGTTRYYNADGTPSCFIRGKGLQPPPSAVPMATNETNEVYPTCFSRTFQDHAELVSVRDAASLLTNSPQDGVVKTSYFTATGRLLQRSTWKGGDRLEYATFTQDRLGHLTSMTRYQDPQAGANPVTSGWHLDSLGQLLELDEPDSVPQFHKYSHWGELLETNRTVEGALKKVLQKYDALGRLIHSEQQTGGVVDPETVHGYTYDQGVNVAPQVTPTNVLGRLAQATWPTGSVTFSYDDLGRTNAQVFTDAKGGSYVEKHTLHTDGSPSALDLFLPDTGYTDEHVDYTYDSAGRGRSVKYTNGASQDLYQASIIDSLGRVREAQYALATYTADYADVGRRLMKKVAVASPAGTRSISFGGFDPISRESSRTEVKKDTVSNTTTTTTTSTSWTYDAIGRLSSAVQTGRPTTDFNQQFTYDPLGNLLEVTNTGASATTTTLTYATTDRDRICHIAFGADNDTACNVTYDELGSITSQPARNGHREYTYLVDGSVRKITNAHGSSAQFRYDAFGMVQELDLDPDPSMSTDGRQDRRYGNLITLRQETIDGSPPQPVFTRKIPLHDGSVATLHGSGGPWTFEYGEQRGNRFFTDQKGAFVQDVDYQPFGTPTPTGAQSGSQLHSNKQWNLGDALAAFGISQLGARLYDPVIGRFISRDPLLIPRTGATTNPYAFASNDPVNRSDPTGLEDCDELNPDCPSETGPDTSGYRYWDTSDAHGFGSERDTVHYIGPRSVSHRTPSHLPVIHNPPGGGLDLISIPLMSLEPPNSWPVGDPVVPETPWEDTTTGYQWGPIAGIIGELLYHPDPPAGVEWFRWGVEAASVALGGYQAVRLGVAGVRAVLAASAAAEFGGEAAAGVVGEALAAETAEGAGVRFTQTTASVAFKNGPLAGQTIGEVAGGLRAGTIQAGQLPVDVVVRGGQTLAINTRSTLALTRAGVPVSEWTMVNRTGDAFFENLLTERLARNGLTDLGTDVLRITGAGPNASATW